MGDVRVSTSKDLTDKGPDHFLAKPFIGIPYV